MEQTNVETIASRLTKSQRALAAARQQTNSKQKLETVAGNWGISTHLVSEGKCLLKIQNQQLISDVESGKVTLYDAFKQLGHPRYLGHVKVEKRAKNRHRCWSILYGCVNELKLVSGALEDARLQGIAGGRLEGKMEEIEKINDGLRKILERLEDLYYVSTTKTRAKRKGIGGKLQVKI